MQRTFIVLGLVVCCATLPFTAQAQKVRPIPYPVFPTPQFEEAVANGTRTATGMPGEAYWTNTATYAMNVSLSPVSRILRGESTITYTNNSPDRLDDLWIHLRQNLHKAGAVRNRPQQLTGGVQVSKVTVNDTWLVERSQRELYDVAGYAINGTLMRIALPEPLASGETVTLAFAWSFEVPEAGAPRMGQDGEVFYLGYWYPQVAVYDDVNGWKADQYMGNGEFYMGYADYTVAITVPEGWLVSATGDLVNAEEVLTERVRERLTEAASTRDIVQIVDVDERVAGMSTERSRAGTLTWRFVAENVRDFAFGTSDQYLWQATSANVGDLDGDGENDTSMIHGFYRPEGQAWHRVAEFGQFSVEYMSEWFLPYPYPHMTVVEGIIGGGMEYPMITIIGGQSRSPQSLFGTTFHEIAHMWFPMIIGQDEKQYTWMDEGLTSFNSKDAKTAFWGDDAWGSSGGYYSIAGTGGEVELMRHGDQYPYGTRARGIAGYSKPAVMLHALRGIVGEDLFWQAFRTYAERWTFKHPQPYDLFNTFEDVIGRDLDWFWTPMVYETWTLDQAIKSVESTADGVTVTIEDLGLTPMPVPLRVTYADGTVAEEWIPVETWLADTREAQLRFDAGTVTRVEIDPNRFLPDIERDNNVWEQP